jgi:hypothetical protein
MNVPNGDVGDLAKGMIQKHPTDAVDRAALVTNMLFLLGRTEMSKKWLLVRAEIKRMQAGQRSARGGAVGNFPRRASL